VDAHLWLNMLDGSAFTLGISVGVALHRAAAGSGAALGSALAAGFRPFVVVACPQEQPGVPGRRLAGRALCWSGRWTRWWG